MTQTSPSTTAFAEADAFFHDQIASRQTYALLFFATEQQFVLPLDQANTVMSLIAAGDLAKQQSSNYRSTRNTLPTLRILTRYEHRCHWLANYFDLSISDIEAIAKPDPIREFSVARKLDFTPVVPPELEHVLDEDIGG